MQFENEPDKKPVSATRLALGAAAMAPVVAVGAWSADKIHDHAVNNPPTSSLEEIQENLGVTPKSAPAPVEMPAAQLPEIDLANTVAVEMPAQKQL